MDTKSQIAETAFQLLMENGYKATSIAQLVNNSGVSKGAFYHYFKSKKAIYEYVIDCYFLSYYRDFDWKLLENRGLDEFLEIVPTIYAEFIAEIKAITNNNVSRYFILFFESYNNLAPFKTTIQDYYRRVKETLTDKFINEKKMSAARAENETMNIILKFEGLLFWLAIFPNEKPAKFLHQLGREKHLTFYAHNRTILSLANPLFF